MPIQSRRSINNIYDEVREYDLVLTADAPLSLALNRRVERPRLGRFAATPRMAASGEFNPADERPLFHEVLADTDLSWKQAAFLVQNILSAWDETGSPEGILEYEAFDTPATRTALSTVVAAESSYRDVMEYSIPPDTDVAVVGIDQFTELDRQILPPEYDTVSPFDAGEFELPELGLFDSPTAIVDALIENIDRERADEVGIVLEESSQYRPLLESRFDSADIPYYGGPGFGADLDLRTFLRLLRVSQLEGEWRVSDVRGILGQLGEYPSIEDDDKRLSAVNSAAIETLRSILGMIDGATFGEAIEVYESWAGADLSPLERELKVLDTIGKPVTRSRIDDLEFYLDTYEIPIHREDEGVLLASANSSVYVDRPVVFYLGLSAEWTRSIEDRPWVDAQRKDAKHLQEFQLLLQNGQQRHFLVQNSEGGDPITPCLYFHDLLADPVGEFREFPHVPHGSRFSDLAGESGFAREPVADAPPPREESTMSNSTLKRLVNCPRDVFFDQVVEQPDRDYFTKGNLFHDFAEFYVVHPDTIRETSLGELVEFGVEQVAPFLDELERPLLRTEIEAGFENIIEFVDSFPPTDVAFDAYEKIWDDNVFSSYFDESIADSTTTEQWFEDPDLGARGVVDLLHAPDALVDFKTSTKKTPAKVVDNASFEPSSDTPDFQALLYLAHHRRLVPDEQLTFRFVHLTDNLDDVVTGTAEIEDTFTTITYHPQPFAEFVPTEQAYDLLIEGVSEGNDRRKTLERLGYERYREFFADWGFPAVEGKDEILEREVFEAFTRFATEHVGDYKYVQKGVRSALRTLIGIRNERFFADDMTAFESFLRERLLDLNEYKTSRFPVGEDPNWDRVDHRDLILTGGDS